jgi:hypothetical protein
MTQVTNYAVPNGPRAEVRQNINAVLAALRDLNSGPSAPPNPVPNMLWMDTSVASQLRIRDAGNANWVPFAQAAGFGNISRNILINPTFAVNQRGVSGTVTLAAGTFGHDRWKAGASGCTYAFASAGGVTTLNIISGSLQQVINGADLRTGPFVLSWTGSAPGKIGDAAYTASPQLSGVAGGANITIEFGPGTLSSPQFEEGFVPTLFTPRATPLEEHLCGFFYRRLGFAANCIVISGVNYGVGPGNLTASATFSFPPMRAVPTATIINPTAFSFVNASNLSILGLSNSFMALKIIAGGATGDFSCASTDACGFTFSAEI